jgi:hypothetical protein
VQVSVMSHLRSVLPSKIVFRFDDRNKGETSGKNPSWQVHVPHILHRPDKSGMELPALSGSLVTDL